MCDRQGTVGGYCKESECQVRQTSLTTAITVQKDAASPALLLIFPVCLCLSLPLPVFQGAAKNGMEEQRHQSTSCFFSVP